MKGVEVLKVLSIGITETVVLLARLISLSQPSGAGGEDIDKDERQLQQG